ncbi:MAG: hypothetical protein ACLQOQ_18970 [Beijerinckiaceae bacterium]
MGAVDIEVRLARKQIEAMGNIFGAATDKSADVVGGQITIPRKKLQDLNVTLGELNDGEPTVFVQDGAARPARIAKLRAYRECVHCLGC